MLGKTHTTFLEKLEKLKSFLEDISLPWWARMGFSALFIIFVLQQVDYIELLQAALTIDPLLAVVAFITFFCIAAVMTAKWESLLRKKHLISSDTSFFQLLLRYWIGDGVSLVGLGSIAGDVQKAMGFQENKKEILVTNVVDKILSLIWYVLAGLLFYVLFIVEFWLVAVSIIILWVLLIVGLRKNAFTEQNFTIAHMNFALLGLLLTSISYYVSFQFVGILPSLTAVILYVTAINLAITIPISFSGLGLREIVTIQFATMIGASIEEALVVSTVYLLAGIVYKLLGAILFIVTQHTSTLTALE